MSTEKLQDNMAKALESLDETLTLAKAHVDQYTRKDGTLVQAHDTKVAARAAKAKKITETAKKSAEAYRKYLLEQDAEREAKTAKVGEHVVHKDGRKAKVLQQHRKDYLVEEPNGKTHYWEHDEADRHTESDKPKKTEKPAMHERGDSVHHPKLNQTGHIIGHDGDHYEVRTIKGKAKWHHKDVEKVDDYD